MNCKPQIRLPLPPDLSISAVLEIVPARLAPNGHGRLEAEILLCDVLAVERSYLHAWPEWELTAAQWHRFVQLLARRVQGEPLAYIRGRQAFWSLDLQVTPATLIPRPETELLVELALQRIPAEMRLTGADLGTGSGAIALAIASERPSVQMVSTDISAAALAVARENARRLGIANVVFQRGDWLAPLKGQSFDFIVSNPPYVAAGDPHLTRGDLPFEPDTALVGGETGLEAIHAIAAEAREVLRDGGWLLLEHGYNQGPATVELLTTLGYRAVAGFRDLAGMPRAVIGRWRSGPPRDQGAGHGH